MVKRRTINLYNHKKEKNPIRSLRNKVLECLGDSIFEIQSVQDFAFESLKCFYPINRSLTNDIASIEKACEKIFKIFPIMKARLFRYDAGGTKEIVSEDPELTPIQKFLFIYLQFETSPGIAIREIESLVKQDMIELNDLIKWYETQDFIKEHLAKNSLPRTQDERMVFDYYYRCLKEQQSITDYYLSGIKKRALTKANYWGNSGLKQMISASERFRDRPYHYAHYFSYPYFDCRKIDLIANKVSEFAFDESGKLDKLYATNREAFYRLLFKRTKPSMIMQEFRYYLPYLPLSNDRTPIFDELEKLFKRKSWIGFYSLALTQIEGLFSEMYTILNPAAESNRKALPDKVQYARKFHEMSNYYFDYYQYHIPTLRNKFMHFGYDEDFKMKSFDLLFDLRQLLKIFMELNNPLIKIKQLHIKRKLEDFINYAEYSNYFQLLNDLTVKQRKEIESDIKIFEMEFLIPYCNAEYVCIEVAEGLPLDIEKFINDSNQKLSGKGKSFDFGDRNFKNLNDQIDSDHELAEIISDCYLFNRREGEALLSYHIFLNNYKKYLSGIDKNYLKILDEVKSKYATVLANISKTKAILQNKD